MVSVAVVNKLHMDVLGDGVPALFVHGSFGRGLETFPEQRALSDEYQVVIIDRCGFGGRASLEAAGWPVDMHDVAALLDDVGPAHMVGQSYGAVVVLLAAGLRPERVRSLVAIEPPAFEVARGDVDADARTTSLKPVFDRATNSTADEFVADWAQANGMPEERLATWIEGFGDQEWAAAEASRRERWPGDAPSSSTFWRLQHSRRCSCAEDGNQRWSVATAQDETTLLFVARSATASADASLSSSGPATTRSSKNPKDSISCCAKCGVSNPAHRTMHGQTCANTSDQPSPVTLALSHALH
jgi:pimeloyl-ACP methyl ester carboxylesterase